MAETEPAPMEIDEPQAEAKPAGATPVKAAGDGAEQVEANENAQPTPKAAKGATPKKEKATAEKKAPATASKKPTKAAAAAAGDVQHAEEGGKSQGLYDKPPVVEGKRERKQVERLEVVVPVKAAEPTVKEGKGTKLGDISNVHFKLNKIKGSDDLIVNLHNLLFKRKGTTHERKRNIFAFSGIVYEGDAAAERAKLVERLGKWTTPQLQALIDAFDMPRPSEGNKDSKVERLVEFLEKPKGVGTKDLVAEADKKKAAAQRKREREAKKKEKAAAKKAKAAKAAAKKPAAGKKGKKKEEEEESEPEEESEEEEHESSEEPESSSSEEEEVSDDEEAPKKKKAKKAAPVAAKKEKGTPAGKKAAGKKGEEGEEGMPGDKEVEAAVKELMSKSDLSEISVKVILASLKERFGVDMAPKKPLVKAVAQEYIQQHAEELEALQPPAPGDGQPEGQAAAEDEQAAAEGGAEEEKGEEEEGAAAEGAGSADE